MGGCGIDTNDSDLSRRLVTPNGGLVRESSQNALHSGVRIVVICSYIYIYNVYVYGQSIATSNDLTPKGS